MATSKATTAGQPPVIIENFRLTVDHGMTLEQMIEAGGYDWHDIDIAPIRFPLTPGGVAEYEGCLIQFNRPLKVRDAEAAIAALDPANPWSAAKIEHGLAFGAAFPDHQRKQLIISLGSIVGMRWLRRGTFLNGNAGERRLSFDWWRDNWGNHAHFLAVRPVVA